MPSFRTGTVTALLSERPGLQRIEVDGEPAYVLTQLIGEVAPGDRVVLNTTAVELGLGTGGSHVVHWNLARDAFTQPGRGHVMKLRYTSLQLDTGVTEEDAEVAAELGGMPVVACALHSQVAAVAVAFKHEAPDATLVYVMTDGGALPLALSDVVYDLRAAGLVDATVTAGQAFGGDYEAVNIHSALAVAHSVAGADAVVAGIGPGVVGTGTRLGHTGLDVTAIVNATAAMAGTPIVAVRYSEADTRDRHRGASHHSTTAMELAAIDPIAPTPEATDVPDVAMLLEKHGIVLTTMGRDPSADPMFFAYAAAAGVTAARQIQRA